MAYWRGGAAALPKVAAAAKGLRTIQTTSDLAFRIVLHYGKVAMGGAASLTETASWGRN